MTGFIHVYTGNGKGKTTSVVGLTMRAIGAGLKVAFLQFFKPETSSEVKILKKFSPQVLYASFHKGGFVKDNLSQELRNEIIKGYSYFKKILHDKKFDVVVLDEITYAFNWKIIDLTDFLNTLKEKPNAVEIIITGRDAPPELIEIADLVSEIKEIKHYFNKKVSARIGIEF